MTSPSLYEHLFPLTTVMKQRVVENFDGNDLDERWTKLDFGVATFGMDDVVNNGYKIVTGITTNDNGALTFNNIRHYSKTAAVCIGVYKVDIVASAGSATGFANVVTDFVANNYAVIWNNAGISSDYTLTTKDGGTSSSTNFGISRDNIFHVNKVEVKSASAEGSQDGVLKATNTERLPTLDLQPTFIVSTRTAAARQGNIRYIEAYNT